MFFAFLKKFFCIDDNEMMVRCSGLMLDVKC